MVEQEVANVAVMDAAVVVLSLSTTAHLKLIMRNQRVLFGFGVVPGGTGILV